MRLLIGTIIFWFTTIGIKKYIEDKFKIENFFTLPLAFTVIGIVMFIAGILNMMKIISILLVLAGCSYLAYYLYKEKITIKEIRKKLKKPAVVIMLIVFAYITIIGMGMHLTHYDNFSHWGLIIKNMFIDNSLPNFEDSVILFKGYQPGSACFIYFYGFLAGKTEGTMIIAQNYLIFGYLTTLFGFIKANNKVLKNILITVFYLLSMSISIRFNDLLVDSLIATMTISSLAILYYYRKDLKKGFIYSLPISIFLLLVKNTGLILAGINCLYMLYLAYKNRNLKKGIKYITITVLILLAFLLIWQNHVKLVFGNLALNSKHSLSTENIILSLRTKGWSNIFLFIKSYFLHLFTFKNNITNIYILVINVVLLLFAFLEKDRKEQKRILLLTSTVDIIYLGYYGILGVMYLLSMPWEEAITFAGYERYMITIIIIIIGIILLYLLGYKEKKYTFKIISTIILLLMVSTIYLNKGTFTSILGNDGYKGSLVEKYDKIINNIKIDKEKEYYVYSPSSKNDFGYLYHMSKYKLNTSNVKIIYDKEELPTEENSILLIIDNDEKITEQLSKGWTKQTDLVYIK